jgi:hypothetical protein
LRGRIGTYTVIGGLLAWALLASSRWSSLSDSLDRSRFEVSGLAKAVGRAEEQAAGAEKKFRLEQLRADSEASRGRELEAELKRVREEASKSPDPGKADNTKYLFRKEKSLFGGHTAEAIRKAFEQIPPLDGKAPLSPEVVSIDPWISLQTVRETDIQAALKGTIDFRLETMRKNGANFTEPQRRAYEASETTYWTVIVDLQRRSNWIRNRLATEKAMPASEKESLNQTFGEIECEVGRLRSLQLAEELRLLGYSE